jgi:hypothetical protein
MTVGLSIWPQSRITQESGRKRWSSAKAEYVTENILLWDSLFQNLVKTNTIKQNTAHSRYIRWWFSPCEKKLLAVMTAQQELYRMAKAMAE